MFDYDVSNPNHMAHIRRMTGVCPQHNILFDKLSVEEHLEIFAGIKGMDPKDAKPEVIIFNTWFLCLSFPVNKICCGFVDLTFFSNSFIIFQISRVVNLIGLETQRDSFAEKLSGGQKRKLSVGIAIMGDPKVVCAYA